MRVPIAMLLLASACTSEGLSPLDGGTLLLELNPSLQVQLIPPVPPAAGHCLPSGIEVTAGGLKLEQKHACGELTFVASANLAELENAEGLPVVAERDGERWSMNVIAPCRRRTLAMIDPPDHVLRPFQRVTLRWELPTQSDSLTAAFTSPDAGPVLEAGVHVDGGELTFVVPLFSGRSDATLTMAGNIREAIDPCEAPSCRFECNDSMFASVPVSLEGP